MKEAPAAAAETANQQLDGAPDSAIASQVLVSLAITSHSIERVALHQNPQKDQNSCSPASERRVGNGVN